MDLVAKLFIKNKFFKTENSYSEIYQNLNNLTSSLILCVLLSLENLQHV